MKLSLIDLLIYLLLFIFVVSLPVDLLNLGITSELVIKIGLRLVLLVFFTYVIHKNQIRIFGNSAFKELIIFLPFFLICFSNFIASFISGGFAPSNKFLTLFLSIILCAVGAVLEEIVFRLFIQNSLVNHTRLVRIVLSALIFSLFHLINVVNARSVGAFVNVLLQTLYTFGLGLVIAFIYEYTHSFVFIAILHFTFNLFNDVLYGFLGGYTSNLVFILTSVGIAMLAAAYGIFLYLYKYNKYQFIE